ncbi:MAG TPA: DUF3341 domain-containing protein [Burkholderiaceae bacterium]
MSDPRWALMAEYETAEALVAAAQAAHDAGFRAIEAYAPFHVEGLAEAVGFERSRLPAVVLAGGLLGGLGGYFLQWYAAVRSYPIEVGARPLHSWPMFVPVTFEMTVLFAAFAAFFGALVANGLPRLAHPIFDAPDFDLATRNRFFLCLRTDDPRFDEARASAVLDATHPLRRAEVAR